MTEIATALDTWNDWIVFPALALVALVLHFRRRKHSTLTLLVGFALLLLGKLFVFVYRLSPLHPLYLAGAVIGALGLILAIAGFVWFMRKDNVKKSVQP